MLRELDYQFRVLERIDNFLNALKEEKSRSDRVQALNDGDPSLNIPVPDFAEMAWKRLTAAGLLPASRAGIPFSSRRDGAGRPVPNAVLKVPTGGGKTFLAANSLSRIFGKYLTRNAGFVLWIVPNEAIYAQTLRQLRNREHPYRQVLDRAAAGRVQVMEKTDPLNARDVEEQLCVMLLMLQSANRETNESLRLFRDRGDVHGFTPPEGEQLAHAELIARVRNLDRYDGIFPMVKDSLGNALRIIRPVVVLDEGHRAVSDLAFKTLYDFNPAFVLELTATPQDVPSRGGASPRPGRYANLLVEVTGKELDNEGMIKMPLNIDARQGTDWKATLNAALDRLKALEREAGKLSADTGRTIRPIMLVQVERTGRDQREAKHIHALDVKDWLLTAGFVEAEIAIKTAETNDLNQPENLDLLAPTNRIRAIITRQALQEGWDCPFAYVLCSLAASSNLRAMTQLVGRILRQPNAERIGASPLDECYVVTHHAGTGAVVKAVKEGLEQDGLADLVLTVAGDPPADGERILRKIPRRPEFAKTDIYLPIVLRAGGGAARPLDYETDILAEIDWRGFNPSAIAAGIPENAQPAEGQLQRISLTEDAEHFALQTMGQSAETVRFDPSYAVRMISDLVPNPFVGREIVEVTLKALRRRGFDDQKLGALGGLIIDELRRGLEAERTARAEKFFKSAVQRGAIQFRLRLDTHNWRMPFETETMQSAKARRLFRDDGPLQRSLFDPLYEDDFNSDEREVAVYLDADQALTWWHRNVARSQYSVQGWRRERVYPDFIFAVKRSGGTTRVTVLETKGDHLDNPDTAYKRDLLRFLTKNFSWDKTAPVGKLEMLQPDGSTIEGELILLSEWRSKLPAYLRE